MKISNNLLPTKPSQSPAEDTKLNWKTRLVTKFSVEEKSKPGCILACVALPIFLSTVAMGLGFLAIIAALGVTFSAVIITTAVIIPISIVAASLSCGCCCVKIN